MPVNIGEPIMAALEFIGKFLVIEAEEVEEGGLEVVDVDLVLDRVEADVVRGSVGDAGFDAATGHPDGEGVGMVVPSPALAIFHRALKEGGATELASPDHQGVIEQPSLFEVLNKGG